MRSKDQSRRATALVITVGLLAVLAVIGFGFAVLSRLHHDTSLYYRAAAQIDLLAQAGFQYALRDIRYGWTPAKPATDPLGALDSFPIGAISEPTDNPACLWYWGADGNSNPDKPGGLPYVPTGCYFDYESGKGNASSSRYCNLRSSSYALVHDVLGDYVAVTSLHVEDSASKINLNDNYGDDSSDSVLRDLLTDLLTEIGIKNFVGSDFVIYRNKLPDKKFTSLAQLKQATNGTSATLTAQQYDTLKHYVTIYSWPHDPPSVDAFKATTFRPDHTSFAPLATLQARSGKLRSPVNINTAPRPVLVALLQRVKRATGTQLTIGEARAVADWIIRKRDPENVYHWRTYSGGTFSPEWSAWLNSSDYKNNARKRCKTGWRSYPLGPFRTWYDFMDFAYSLTDGTGSDPFPQEINEEKAEALIAAFCPNPFPSIVPRDTYHLGYLHLKQDLSTEQKLRYVASSPKPNILGRNDLDDTKGSPPELCFSSKGRYEIAARTYAFQKADFGKATGQGACSLTDSGKSWGTTPLQWRGFSVLLYDGKGKGQLRGIVANTNQTLTVAKWSTPPQTDDTNDNRSRYYILGPAPLYDRPPTTTMISLGDNGAVLTDADANWENGQWAGQRVVIYRRTINKGAGAQGQDTETISEDSIQERIILDNTASTLILSPALDVALATPAADLTYMILGSYGAADHEAALKAYEVIYQTNEKDFVEGDNPPSDCADVAVGPNPLSALQSKVTDANRTLDGWVSVVKDPISGGFFIQNFKAATLEPDDPSKGKRRGGTPPDTLVKDVFEGGCLFPDGLYLRDKSGHTVTYSVEAPPLVGDNRHEGGFVSFWFRPDKEFFSGAGLRTLIRIKGAYDAAGGEEDLRLVYDPSDKKIKLIVRSLTKRKYEEKIVDTNHPDPTDVFYYLGSQTFVDDTYSDSPKDWKPGQWHHLAFAWYECVNDSLKQDPPDAGWKPEWDSDTKPETDWRDDDPTISTLDDEVYGRVRLWVDGKGSIDDKKNNVKAFNLCPTGATDPDKVQHPCLQIGDSPEALAGTIDGIVAKSHIDKELLDATFGVPLPAGNPRYKTSGSYALYASRTIQPAASGPVCLGTVAWTGLFPYKKAASNWDSAKWPLRVKVSLGVLETAELPRAGSTSDPFLGEGGPLRNASDGTINSLIAGSIRYKIQLISEAYYGDTAADTFFPPGWQTPIFEDITITYLGPVVYYYWR